MSLLVDAAPVVEVEELGADEPSARCVFVQYNAFDSVYVEVDLDDWSFFDYLRLCLTSGYRHSVGGDKKRDS